MQKQIKRVVKNALDLVLKTEPGERVAKRSAKYVFEKYEGAGLRTAFYQSIMDETDGRVYAGPYRGMKLIHDFAWGAFEPSYVLGCYEQEIQGVMAAHDWSRNTSFADIGCANGYHAVGVTRISENFDVFAFDIDPNAIKITQQMAEANSVTDRIHARGEFDPAQKESGLGESPFFLIDIEGAEAEFIPRMLPHYEEADFLIECHDRRDHRIRAALESSLAATHELVEIHREGRSPAIHPMVEQLPDNKAWRILSENRSRSDIWLYGKARAR